MQAHLAVPESLLRSAAVCQWEQFLHGHFGRQWLRKKVCSYVPLDSCEGPGRWTCLPKEKVSSYTKLFSKPFREGFSHWVITGTRGRSATELPLAQHCTTNPWSFSTLVSTWHLLSSLAFMAVCIDTSSNYVFQGALLNNCKDIYFPGEEVDLPQVFAVTFWLLTNLSVICLEGKLLQRPFHLLFKSNFLKALLHSLWIFTSSVTDDGISRTSSVTSLIRK